jgi:hypothetical protein
MDFAFIRYLQQIGTDPTEYIQLQASYLRFLAENFEGRSKSFSSPTTDKESPQVSTKPKTNRSEFSISFEKSYQKSSAPSESRKISAQPSHRRKYDDIPIQTILSIDDLSNDNYDKAGKRKKSPDSKYKNSGLVSKAKAAVSSVNTKRTTKSTEIGDKNVKSRSISLFSHKSSANGQSESKKYLKKGQGTLCANFKTVDPPYYSPQKIVKSRYLTTESSSEKKPKTANINPSESSLQNKYSKMIKDLEIKKKKLEKDCEEFYASREKEMKSFQKLKNEEKRRLENETENIKKQWKNIEERKKTVKNINEEVEELRTKIATQEEKFAEELKKMECLAEELKTKNWDLMSQARKMNLKVNIWGTLTKPKHSDYKKTIEVDLCDRKETSESSKENNKTKPAPEATLNEPEFESELNEFETKSKDVIIPVLRLDKLIGRKSESCYVTPGQVLTKKSHLSQYADNSRIPGMRLFP